MERYIIGNWKMHLTLAEAIALGQSVSRTAERHPKLNIVIAPSLPWIVPLHEALKWRSKNLYIASQVVSHEEDGAFTGDVSAKQLRGLVTYCLVGHSERRRYHQEKGEIIRRQIQQLLKYGITPIVCFGEMKQSPQSRISDQIIQDLEEDIGSLQTEEIEQCLFAYEPLWAIGTDNPAKPEYIEKAIHSVTHWFGDHYQSAPVMLYGGSVTDDDAEALAEMKILRGALVGGASIHSQIFARICAAFGRHV